MNKKFDIFQKGFETNVEVTECTNKNVRVF